MGDVRVDEIVQTAVVRRGDTLIVRVPREAFSPEVARKFREDAASRLPGVKVVVIGADEIAIYRPEASE